MRAEIRKAVEAGPQPREPDNAVFDRYGMESVAHQVDDLYEQTLAAPSSEAAVGDGSELTQRPAF